MPYDYIIDLNSAAIASRQALPAAAAVTTSPYLQSEFCPTPSDSAGTYPCTWRKARRKLLQKVPDLAPSFIPLATKFRITA